MTRDAESFLGAVLSRGGPLALPYDGQVKRLVRLHLLELIKDLPSLSVRLRSYTHLDGSDVQLLMADGTVPMFYQSAKYNIPVAIWLPEGYPVQPPIAYVVPTSDMIITPQHPYVDGSGLVTSPYLARWQYPDSNLRELAQDMSMLFADNPPLFAKPAGWSAPVEQRAQRDPQRPRHNSPPLCAAASRPPQGADASPGDGASVHVHNPMIQRREAHATSSPSGAAAWQGMGNGAMPWTTRAPAPGTAACPAAEDTAEVLQAACRSSSLDALVRRVQSSMASAAASGDAGTAALDQCIQELLQRNSQLSHEVSLAQNQRLAYDTLAHELASTVARLESWLAANEAKIQLTDQGNDASGFIAAMDGLSAQALAVQAEDLAIEDCLYALDKALNSSTLSPTAYLKQVRALCRRQLLVRVLSNKIATQQKDIRIASASSARGNGATSSVPGVQMAVGDTWYSTGVLPNPLTMD